VSRASSLMMASILRNTAHLLFAATIAEKTLHNPPVICKNGC
jgi:hypothetical protein